jgi:hypothetical protein
MKASPAVLSGLTSVAAGGVGMALAAGRRLRSGLRGVG